jgi:capsular polysaccharide transport system permease protein
VANRYLVSLTRVSLKDYLIATTFLELIQSLLLAFIIFLTIFMVTGESPNSFTNVFFAIVISWLLGIAFGHFFSSISRVSDTFSRAIPILLRPLFWISGIFYIAAELPGGLLSWLSFNPLLHVIEGLREAFYFGFYSQTSSFYFVLVISFSLLVFSVFIYRWADKHQKVRFKI